MFVYHSLAFIALSLFSWAPFSTDLLMKLNTWGFEFDSWKMREGVSDPASTEFPQCPLHWKALNVSLVWTSDAANSNASVVSTTHFILFQELTVSPEYFWKENLLDRFFHWCIFSFFSKLHLMNIFLEQHISTTVPLKTFNPVPWSSGPFQAHRTVEDRHSALTKDKTATVEYDRSLFKVQLWISA